MPSWLSTGFAACSTFKAMRRRIALRKRFDAKIQLIPDFR
jgi:hypothetical protein